MTPIRVRSSVLCIQDNQLLVLKYQDSSGDTFWGLPGGGVEAGETPLMAALREAEEETGYQVELMCDPGLVIEYDFLWKDMIIPCRTHWFGVRPIAGSQHQPRAGDEDYLTELRWWPLADWRQVLAGHEEIQAAMAQLLAKMHAEGLIKLEGV